MAGLTSCNSLDFDGLTAGSGSNRNVVTSPSQSSATPATRQGQNGTTSSMGSTQLQTWVQGAIAKISSTTVLMEGPIQLLTPSVVLQHLCLLALIQERFQEHRQLDLLGTAISFTDYANFCSSAFSFRVHSFPDIWGLQIELLIQSLNLMCLLLPPGMVEEITKPVSAVTKSDDGLPGRAGQLVPGAKGGEEAPPGRSRVDSGNAGQGYTYEEVAVGFHGSFYDDEEEE